MIVGLGTGSTASHFIRELGKAGLKVAGIPTSEESRRLAQEVGIRLTTLKEHFQIDLTVDGADEVAPNLDLIKGLGGALVREKIVAHASRRVVIVVDESKLVEKRAFETRMAKPSFPTMETTLSIGITASLMTPQSSRGSSNQSQALSIPEFSQVWLIALLLRARMESENYQNCSGPHRPPLQLIAIGRFGSFVRTQAGTWRIRPRGLRPPCTKGFDNNHELHT